LSERAIEFPVEGLSDGEIRVRLMSEADVPAIVAACQDPAVRRYTTVPDPYGEGDAHDWSLKSLERLAEGMGVEAVAADAESDEVVGSVGIRRHATDAGRWVVGYLVAPEARGRGVATRAVRLISRWAFDELGAERIELCVEPENTSSQRVAERAGFQREGLLRAYQPVAGVRRDMLMYSLLRGELR
jgi:RimJ/RimL family protein N-acetyltransferase